eukprot:8706588-Lingulodinium_polyedra.AAC.1
MRTRGGGGFLVGPGRPWHPVLRRGGPSPASPAGGPQFRAGGTRGLCHWRRCPWGCGHPSCGQGS